MINEFRTLEFLWKTEETPEKSYSVLNYCHLDSPYIRKVQHRHLTGGYSNLVSQERPYLASETDLSPYYPFQDNKNTEIHKLLKKEVNMIYPEMLLMGRLATYKYLDIYMAIGQARNLASKFK